jgi:lipid II:glycine glycyltransferase (peptidoglycan interpeptide bridge formation enzyme)
MNFEVFGGKSEDWDNWLLEQKNEEFLQSYQWGEFQAREGKPTFRIIAKNAEKTLYLAQGFVHSLPLGLKYLYFPHNVSLAKEDADEFLDFLGKEGFVFARFEPTEDLTSKKYKKISTPSSPIPIYQCS